MTENPDENLEVGCSNQPTRTKFPATETPIQLAAEMAKLAKIGIGDRVLEPSAGYGPLAFAALSRGAHVTCVELNEKCVQHLLSSGWHKPEDVYRADFLQWEGTNLPLFDAVLMCPPRNSIPHIEHAFTFLKPKGRLVALIRRDTDNLEKYIDNYRPLPYDMFHIDGEPVESGLLVF